MSKPIVILFNQITDTILDALVERKYITSGGVPTGDVQFRMSTPPFNTRLAEKSARVKTFIDAVKASKGAYNMPAYGDALFALIEHPLAKESAIPYTLGVDDFVVQKAAPKWKMIADWLTSVEAELPEAKAVLEFGGAFITLALEFVAKHGSSLTIEQHRKELLEHCLGADWREVSENLNSSKFLKLFGATDALLEAFVKAKVLDSKGEQVQLLNEARWVANFINLFKPTTEFKKGAVSDMLNFAAMFSGLQFPDKLTDQDSMKALQAFDCKSEELALVQEAFFDMEPDDVGVLTFVHKHCTNASIVRVYPTKEIASPAEDFLATRVTFSPSDSVLIDPLLENAKVLASIYCCA